MRTPARFEKPPVAIPADERMPPVRHDYSRPVSKRTNVGFGFLVLGLSILTFCVTIWGANFTSELQAQENVVTVQDAVNPKPAPVAGTRVVYEPKTVARLPVFGGLTPSR